MSVVQRMTLTVLAMLAFLPAFADEGVLRQKGETVLYSRNDGREIVVNPKTPVSQLVEIQDVIFLITPENKLFATTKATIEATFPQSQRNKIKGSLTTGSVCGLLAFVADSFCYLISGGEFPFGYVTAAAFTLPAMATYSLLSLQSAEAIWEVNGINLNFGSINHNYKKLQKAHLISTGDTIDIRLTYINGPGDVNQVLLSEMIQQKNEDQLPFKFFHLREYMDFSTWSKPSKMIYQDCDSALRPEPAGRAG